MLKSLKLKSLMLLLAFIAGGSVTAAEVVDVLNQQWTGITATNYTEFTGKTSNSDAVYAGQCAGSNSSIQLRSNNNNSGIVTTVSGGKVTKIAVGWESHTTNGRTLNVYGKNTAYSAATDLYDSSTQGTLLGTIVYGTSTELEIEGDYEYIGFRSNSGAMYLAEVDITWETGGAADTRISTTLEISDPVTAGDVGEFINFPEVTVRDASGAPVSNASYTWSSNNEEVAAIGNGIELLAAGTAKITATFEGNNDYKGSSASFTITVVDPNVPGASQDNPYTVAQARAAIDAGTGVTGVYAKGIVSKIVTAFNSQYGNISYNISEDGTTDSDQLQAYRGFDKDGVWFTSADDVQVGDEVIIYGNLTKYNSTYEFAANNQRVWYNRAIRPIIKVENDNVELTSEEVSGSITFTLENAVEDGQLSVSVSPENDWLNVELFSDDAEVLLTCDPNQEAQARTAIVTITYTYNNDNDKVEKQVTVTQATNLDAVIEATCAEVIAGEDGAIYQVTGTGTKITNATYGNWILKDETGEITIYGTLDAEGKTKNFSSLDIQVGDKVTVKGPRKLYGGTVELVDVTVVDHEKIYGVAPEQTEYAITSDAQVVTINLTYMRTKNYGIFIKDASGNACRYEDVLDYTYNGANCWSSDDAGNINIKFQENTTPEERKVYLHVVCINEEENIQDVSETITITQEAASPSITLDKYEDNVGASSEGTVLINVTYKNIDLEQATIQAVLCDEEGVEADYGWISAYIGESNHNLYFEYLKNTGEERTAYLYVAVGDVRSDVLRITQGGYVKDYAELPFNYDNGYADIEGTAGLTQNGINSKDYADDASKLKFDSTGDWLLLHVNESPSLVYFNLKGNGYESGKFTVYSSTDGVEFTSLAEYTDEIEGSNKRFGLEVPQGATYIKWEYTEKTKGNVGLGMIEVLKYDTKEEITVSDAGWATYITKYPLQFEDDEAFVVTKSSATSVKFVGVNEVPAGTAILVRGIEGEERVVYGQLVAEAEAPAANLLKASDGTVTGGSTIYALANLEQGVGFYIVDESVIIPEGKAYLEISEDAAAGARPFLAIGGDDTTGINAVEQALKQGGEVFDLQGRRVAQPSKGLYIVNGQKVVVK